MTETEKTTNVEAEKLLRLAREARRHSYCPYSKFSVGAALLSANGNIYTGCNVENASYGATICAERVAIDSAVAAGDREIRRLAVLVSGEDYARPCGICLQVMAEFAAEDFVLYAGRADGSYQTWTMSDLLPKAFRLEQKTQMEER